MKRLVDAEAGLEFERSLFAGAGTKIGVWTSQQSSLVCPSAYERRAGFEVAAQNSNSRAWPVHLRPTGGGTVPQGPGMDNLVLAFDAPKRVVIEDVYRLLTHIIKRALGDCGEALETGDTPGSFCDGAWNLSVNGRKIVGTAQRWRPQKSGKARVLAHALILTQDRFADGAHAVSLFHRDLGLDAVESGAHTSLEAAFGLAELNSEHLMQTAAEELSVFAAQIK